MTSGGNDRSRNKICHLAGTWSRWVRRNWGTHPPILNIITHNEGYRSGLARCMRRMMVGSLLLLFCVILKLLWPFVFGDDIVVVVVGLQVSIPFCAAPPSESRDTG